MLEVMSYRVLQTTKVTVHRERFYVGAPTYRYKKERCVAFKICQNVDPTGILMMLSSPVINWGGVCTHSAQFSRLWCSPLSASIWWGHCPQIFHSVFQFGWDIAPNISLSASIWWGHCPQIFHSAPQFGGDSAPKYCT